MTLTALALVGMSATLGAPAGLAGTPIKDPSSIACPKAPSGWARPPVTKRVATPESVPLPTAEEHLATGGNVDTVECLYHQSVKQVSVSVSYALQTDPNPVNDFDLGCGHGALAWTGTYRTYRVSSLTQWAIATLVDSQQFLSSHDLPAFEGVARSLLHASNGYGHTCSLAVKPSPVSSRFYFDFRIGSSNVKETFWTAGTSTKSALLPISKVMASTVDLRVATKAGTHELAFRFDRGIDFRPQTAKTPGQARFHVIVTRSRVAGCRKGAGGTLTVSTKPSVLLTICGQTFLRGQAPQRIRITT
jgi:hypothetical protein